MVLFRCLTNFNNSSTLKEAMTTGDNRVKNMTWVNCIAQLFKKIIKLIFLRVTLEKVYQTNCNKKKKKKENEKSEWTG